MTAVIKPALVSLCHVGLKDLFWTNISDELFSADKVVFLVNQVSLNAIRAISNENQNSPKMLPSLSP